MPHTDHDTVKETVAANAPEMPKGLKRPIAHLAKAQLPDDIVRKGRAPCVSPRPATAALRPAHSSEWAKKKPSERTFLETLCAIDLAPPEVYEDKPKDLDVRPCCSRDGIPAQAAQRGPVPVHPIWKENMFLLSIGGAPIFAQALSYYAFPNLKWNAWFAYAICARRRPCYTFLLTRSRLRLLLRLYHDQREATASLHGQIRHA
jgi:hypothetical protein